MAAKKIMLWIGEWTGKICLFAVVLILSLIVIMPGYALLLWLSAMTPVHMNDITALLFTFWPIALLLTLVMFAISVGAHPKRKCYFVWAFPVCRPGWVINSWLLYYFSPIILNGASKLSGWLGQDQIASFLFKYRDSVHIGIPAIVVALLIGSAIVGAVLQWKDDHFPRRMTSSLK